MDEAADHLRTKRPTVSRYETGEVLPVWSTVHMLLTYYDVTSGDLTLAARLYDDAKDEPRSVRLTAGASKAFRKLVNAEREAVRERELAPIVFPGLLQTKSYAQALIGAGSPLHNPDMRPESAVATRMERKKPLEGADPMTLHAIVDEAVVHRQIGGPGVMRGQLEYLIGLADRPNITLQVIPFAAGGYGTMNGSFVLVDYPEPEALPGVYLEYPAGGAWIDDADDVKRFVATFDEATSLAMSPDETTNLLRQQLKSL